MFDSNKVERRQPRASFQAQEFNLELTKVSQRIAQSGTPVITVTFQVRGQRYNNLRVLDTLFVTEDAFPIAINKLQDMGLEVPAVRGSKAETVANKLVAFIQANLGHMTRGFVAEKDGDANIKEVKFYITTGNTVRS